VRSVFAGRRYLCAPFSDQAIRAYAQSVRTTSHDAYVTLTPREREVLQLAAEAQTSAQIGRRLFISPRTVEIHRANMMRKLRVHNQTELIRYALTRGIVPLREPAPFTKR
jgi:DNA-binding NarL/FixJ family response regulator